MNNGPLKGARGRRHGEASPSRLPGAGSASGEVDGRTFEFCVAAAATMANLLVAAGLSLVSLFQADLIAPDGTGPSTAALATAMHAAGPRLALACVCFLAVRAGSTAAITALGAVAGLLQGFDVITGAVQGNSLGTIIPAALAALQWWAIAVLDSRRPAGRISGWR